MAQGGARSGGGFVRRALLALGCWCGAETLVGCGAPTPDDAAPTRAALGAPFAVSEEAALRWPTTGDGAPWDDFGAATAWDGVNLLVGAPGDALAEGGSSGSVYWFEAEGDEFRLRDKLVAPVPRDGGRFGAALQLHQGRLIVGAPGGRRGEPPGTAHVFRRDGMGWTAEAELTPIEGCAGGFGGVLATDGATLLVGGGACVQVYGAVAWGEPQLMDGVSGWASGRAFAVDGDTALLGQSGRAQVYRRGGDGVWAAEAELRSSEPHGDFGLAVALDGERALVAREHHVGNAADWPGAHLFTRSGTTWTLTATFDVFATPVAWDRGRAVLSGRVFVEGAAGWQEVAELVPEVDPSLDEDPRALHLVTGVAGVTAVLGGPPTEVIDLNRWRDDPRRLWLHRLTERGWERGVRAEIGSGAADRAFGSTVRIDDGTLAVDSHQLAGEDRVSLYRRDGNAWEHLQRLPTRVWYSDGALAFNGDRLVTTSWVSGFCGDNFSFETYQRRGGQWSWADDTAGYSDACRVLPPLRVALSEGHLAHWCRDGHEAPGAVCVDGRTVDGWRVEHELPPAEGYSHTGGLALDGDTLAVDEHDEGGLHRVVVYERTADAWERRHTLDDPAPGDTYASGTTLALHGGTLVAVTAGAAHVHVRTPEGWRFQQSLRDPEGRTLAAGRTWNSATAVALGPGALLLGVDPVDSDDPADAGEPGDTGEAGAALLFLRSAGTWALAAELVGDVGVEHRGFGQAVALDRGLAAVAAPEAGTPGLFGNPGEGAVYPYRFAGIPGAPCSVAAECVSGACVDGACCETACAGPEEACTVRLGARHDGECSPVPEPLAPAATAEVAGCGCGVGSRRPGVAALVVLGLLASALRRPARSERGVSAPDQHPSGAAPCWTQPSSPDGTPPGPASPIPPA